MIRITDITLSNMDIVPAKSGLIQEFYDLLLKCGVDFIEISPDILKYLEGKVNIARTVLNDDIFAADLCPYREYKRLIGRCSGLSLPHQMEFELHVNDIRELNILDRYAGYKNIRLTGLDDFMLHDHRKAFSKMKNSFQGRIELCPQNQYDFATALAVEWLALGGQCVASSFLGIGNFAATEEVIMAMRVNSGYRPGTDLSSFRRMKDLAQELTGCQISPHKPVVGDEIFHVEAGIHVDGIIKKTTNFEPFLPETVGARREIILGKHSGRNSVALKLKKHNIKPADLHMVSYLLGEVRKLSVSLGRSISDQEFLQLARAYGKSKKEGPDYEREKISD